jgi:hypothetical protein
MEYIGIDDKRLEYNGTEKGHLHPEVRQNERERDRLFLHSLLPFIAQ